jgi:hypothetical protein
VISLMRLGHGDVCKSGHKLACSCLLAMLAHVVWHAAGPCEETASLAACLSDWEYVDSTKAGVKAHTPVTRPNCPTLQEACLVDDVHIEAHTWRRPT